jgi:cellulose synthase/poly-beta-1,6-N-acetylglucosamine synthase-like glycosyltransferase
VIQGVSFVVPVHNGADTVADVLASIAAQRSPCHVEIVVVDDRSQDDSPSILRRLAEQLPLRIVPGPGRGAAAAINAGLREARFPIVCQVDQDVVLRPGWFEHLLRCFADPSVAAAQGCYVTDRLASICARAMGFDLEQRYAAIDGVETSHVCTGNSAYRTQALLDVGLFDETFGYGYDNDISYRLTAAGFRLVLCREAQSVHRWREGIAGYLVQQYGFGYGRIDIVAKHVGRATGDSVSPAGMMAHPIFMAAALVSWVLGWASPVFGVPSRPFLFAAAILVAGLALERLAAGISAAWRFRDPTPLVFPVLHLGRDLAWVAAILVWTTRRILGREPRPRHSMRPRRGFAGTKGRTPAYTTGPNRPAT